MRLSRRGHRMNTNREPRELANKEFPDHPLRAIPEGVERSFDGKKFSLRIHGGDGIEDSQSQYEYEITLTLKEVRNLLSHSLRSFYPDFPGSIEISNAERKLWNTLFDQWEKRIRALARREKQIRESVRKRINK